MLPEIPVNFVYLAPDGSEAIDRQFTAVCASVPRVGEFVVPQAGSEKVVVSNVYHKFVLNEAMGGDFYQYITVVLKEIEQR